MGWQSQPAEGCAIGQQLVDCARCSPPLRAGSGRPRDLVLDASPQDQEGLGLRPPFSADLLLELSTQQWPELLDHTSMCAQLKRCTHASTRLCPALAKRKCLPQWDGANRKALRGWPLLHRLCKGNFGFCWLRPEDAVCEPS